MTDKKIVLFLDRDGVLNHRIVDGYVRSWDEWTWLPGVLEATTYFHEFAAVFVASNQQGVGKALMTEEALQQIMTQMRAEIHAVGGKLDTYFYCPHLKGVSCECRKPAIGMALQARKAYPEIDLKYAIMVGDSESDLLFGRNAGMKTVWIRTQPEDFLPRHLSCPIYDNLLEFAKDIPYLLDNWEHW